jgi:hypothetical protein
LIGLLLCCAGKRKKKDAGKVHGFHGASMLAQRGRVVNQINEMAFGSWLLAFGFLIAPRWLKANDKR